MLNKIVLLLMGILLGLPAGLYLSTRLHDAEMGAAVRHGRINTPAGIYYLQPVPELSEIEQLRNDVKMLNKKLNRRR